MRKGEMLFNMPSCNDVGNQVKITYYFSTKAEGFSCCRTKAFTAMMAVVWLHPRKGCQVLLPLVK